MAIKFEVAERDELSREAYAERRRCVELVTRLSHHWLALAASVRNAGTFHVREIWPPPFKKVPVVRPGWERQAQQIEDAANALRHLVTAIEDGF